MKRTTLLLTLLVGVVGESAVQAQCSAANLVGKYLFSMTAVDGAQVTVAYADVLEGVRKPALAAAGSASLNAVEIAGYMTFDGTGKVTVLWTQVTNGDGGGQNNQYSPPNAREITIPGTYTVDANCVAALTLYVIPYYPSAFELYLKTLGGPSAVASGFKILDITFGAPDLAGSGELITM